MHDDHTITLVGRIEPGTPDWIYLPFDVPDEIDEISVRYTYDKTESPAGSPGNALDIGIFDERGHHLASPARPAPGFRGWSGGARESFTIGRTHATPGYVPGAINAGTWHIVLGPYTVSPAGMSYRVDVTLRRDADRGAERGKTTEGLSRPSTPPTSVAPQGADTDSANLTSRKDRTRAVGRGAAWYRGDLHVHTVHSDGRWSPEELVAAARDAGLDFIVSTEHNTPTASATWDNLARPDLLVIDGEEVTTRNGHLVAAGLRDGAWLDWRFRAGDGHLPHILDQIHSLGGIAVAAHPYAPCIGCAWKFGYSGLDAVEVWNGSWTPDDEMSLRHWDATLVADRANGSWLPAVAASDSHHAGQPLGLGQTVVWAEDLTRDAIVAGIRSGRVYLAESCDVELEFTARSGEHVAGIGERLRVPETAGVRCECVVRGVTEGVLQFVTDRGTAAAFPIGSEAGSDEPVTWCTAPQESAYVRVEVRRPAAATGLPFGPMLALTNPIFLG